MKLITLFIIQGLFYFSKEEQIKCKKEYETVKDFRKYSSDQCVFCGGEYEETVGCICPVEKVIVEGVCKEELRKLQTECAISDPFKFNNSTQAECEACNLVYETRCVCPTKKSEINKITILSVCEYVCGLKYAHDRNVCSGFSIKMTFSIFLVLLLL